jgi:hypothetical protein
MLARTPTLGRFAPKELPFIAAFFAKVSGFASNTMGGWKEVT